MHARTHLKTEGLGAIVKVFLGSVRTPCITISRSCNLQLICLIEDNLSKMFRWPPYALFSLQNSEIEVVVSANIFSPHYRCPCSISLARNGGSYPVIIIACILFFFSSCFSITLIRYGITLLLWSRIFLQKEGIGTWW